MWGWFIAPVNIGDLEDGLWYCFTHRSTDSNHASLKIQLVRPGHPEDSALFDVETGDLASK